MPVEVPPMLLYFKAPNRLASIITPLLCPKIEKHQIPYIKPQTYKKWENKVKLEIPLLCMGYNINKLHAKIQNERTGSHLFPLKTS